jgi:IS5 family transposase
MWMHYSNRSTKGKKKSKPLRYRPATGVLKALKELPPSYAATIISSNIPSSILELLDQYDHDYIPPSVSFQDFTLGRPRYSMRSRFMAYITMRIHTHHSESMMSQILSKQSLLKSRLQMTIRGASEMRKSPHPTRFAEMRNTFIQGGRLEQLHMTLVGELMEKKAGSKILFCDSTILDLCRNVTGGCKHQAECEWLKGTGKVHEGCLVRRYSGAEFSHKRKDQPYLGYKSHVLKDWRSGQSLCMKLTGAKRADNHVGIEMLEEAGSLLSGYRYFLADKGYDDKKVYSACVEHDLIPIIPLREGGHARFFVINGRDRKRKFRIRRDGTPLCTKGYPMEYIESEEGFTYWGCPQELIKPEDMEDGLCLGYHESTCKCFEVDISHDPRRLCQVPRSEDKWKSIRNLRSHGERVFAWEDHFMGSDRVPFHDPDGIEYYLKMGDITHLILGHIAQNIGLDGLVHPWEIPGLVKQLRAMVVDLNSDRRGIGPWLRTLLEELFGPGTTVSVAKNTDIPGVVVQVAAVV